ncbi:FecCD family ABC transporter permease [Oceanirhabdus seepicola]|uniref:Iron ABC transporter permease n=1 Tax=Oceanirhabdus seepicola TaxID=2828781 RepID=A0A9J6PA82_9CLOT|nr:iron chelate uptake ABC transporter family permease subunit [Oceanirhabdus seepicola]MCM1992293.1 iron ABC transporter permease [Oceanirhabdus seepicola]
MKKLISNDLKIKNKKDKRYLIPIFVVILFLAIIMSAAIGAVKVPYGDTFKIIINKIFSTNFEIKEKSFESIIFYVRLPRVIVSAIVGGALALCGAVMQSMFRNPMADPGIIGISSGASLGAVIAVALNLTSLSLYYMPLLAIIGALGAAFTIYKLSSYKGKIPVLTLILSGIAVSTFLGAINSLILSKIAEYKVREYLFWSIGSLSGRRWEHVRLAFIPIMILTIILLFFSKELNILLLGEEEAHSVGVNPTKARRKILFLTSITTAIAVCVSGNIGFVGLVVPHILRLIVGPDNRILLPLSALGGAIFLIVCDFIARTIIMPAEIGVGIVTSLVGAPYFIYLLMKARKEGISI